MEAIRTLSASQPEHVRTSADQLRGESQYLIATGAIALSVGWYLFLGDSLRASTWFPPLAVMSCCALSLVVTRFRSSIGAVLLVVSILAGNVIFLWTRAQGLAAFFLVATIFAAGALLGPLAALGFGVICSAVIGGAVLDPAVALAPSIAAPAVVLVWFGVILAWASTHPVYT